MLAHDGALLITARFGRAVVPGSSILLIGGCTFTKPRYPEVLVSLQGGKEEASRVIFMGWPGQHELEDDRAAHRSQHADGVTGSGGLRLHGYHSLDSAQVRS